MIDASKINIQNKKAGFEFEILERYEAGIKLVGSEIKSIRNGGGSINEAYCLMNKGELFIRNMNIPEYTNGGYANHEAVTLRKLLLTKRELERIDARVREKGLTIIPLCVFVNERGFAKVEIGVGRGKKKFDKRDSLKAKDTKREIDRALKKYK